MALALADQVKATWLVPANVDKLVFILAPCIAVSTAMLSFAVVPFGAVEPPPDPPLLQPVPSHLSHPKEHIVVRAENNAKLEQYRKQFAEGKGAAKALMDIGRIWHDGIEDPPIHARNRGGCDSFERTVVAVAAVYDRRRKMVPCTY